LNGLPNHAAAPPTRGGPSAGSQTRLSAWVAEGLRNGWIRCERPTIEVREPIGEGVGPGGQPLPAPGGDRKPGLSWKVVRPTADRPGMVGSQAMVEAIRNVFPRREQRAWWEPHLRRIEEVVADELAYRETTPSPDKDVLDAYERRADQLVEAAGQAYAIA